MKQQSVDRSDVIKAMELSYDYYSARVMTRRHLKASGLGEKVSNLDKKQMAQLVSSLKSDLPRTQPAIQLLNAWAESLKTSKKVSSRRTRKKSSKSSSRSRRRRKSKTS